MLRGITLTKL